MEKENTNIAIHKRAGRKKGSVSVNTLPDGLRQAVIINKYNEQIKYQREYVRNLSEEKKVERKERQRQSYIKRLRDIKEPLEHETQEQFEARWQQQKRINKINRLIAAQSRIVKSTGCKKAQEQVLKLKLERNALEGNHTIVERTIVESSIKLIEVE